MSSRSDASRFSLHLTAQSSSSEKVVDAFGSVEFVSVVSSLSRDGFAGRLQGAIGSNTITQGVCRYFRRAKSISFVSMCRRLMYHGLWFPGYIAG